MRQTSSWWRIYPQRPLKVCQHGGRDKARGSWLISCVASVRRGSSLWCLSQVNTRTPLINADWIQSQILPMHHSDKDTPLIWSGRTVTWSLKIANNNKCRKLCLIPSRNYRYTYWKRTGIFSSLASFPLHFSLKSILVLYVVAKRIRRVCSSILCLNSKIFYEKYVWWPTKFIYDSIFVFTLSNSPKTCSSNFFGKTNGRSRD